MNLIRKVSEQTAWQLLGKAITSLSTLVILGLVARTYGETGTGILTLALTYLAFYYLIVDFGLNAYFVPLLSKDDYKSVWRNLFGFRVILAVILVLTAVISVYLWPNVDENFRRSILYGAMAILGSAAFVSANAWFQSRLRYDLSVLSSSIGSIITLILVYIFVSAKAPEPFIVFSHMIGWLFCGVTALFIVKWYFKNINPQLDSSFIKKTLTEIWPISATLVLNVIYFRVDAFILGSFRGFAEVGVYNLAYSIFQTALVIPTYIMNSYYPLMVDQFEKNRPLFRSTIIKAVIIMAGISFMGIIATFILSPFMIPLIAGGQGFKDSQTSLNILSLSFPAFFMSAIFMWSLITMRKYTYVLWIYFVGMVLNIGLNLIFTPTYSYISASWITVVTEYLILLLQVIILYRHLK